MLENQVFESFQINYFITFQNNQVNLCDFFQIMVTMYDLKILSNVFYLVIEKLVKFYFIVFIFEFSPNLNWSIFGGNLNSLKKKVWILVEKSP
jgi:hypothetical protein